VDYTPKTKDGNQKIPSIGDLGELDKNEKGYIIPIIPGGLAMSTLHLDE